MGLSLSCCPSPFAPSNPVAAAKGGREARSVKADMTTWSDCLVDCLLLAPQPCSPDAIQPCCSRTRRGSQNQDPSNLLIGLRAAQP
eukprot:1158392-Pelagomonas_calceolata.AAC.20